MICIHICPFFKRFFSHIDFKYFVIHFKTLQWMEKQVSRPMAPHSSTLVWKIPWTEEPGRLQSMGSLRVGHDWATSLSRFTFMHWRRKWQPTPPFLPGESQGQGSLVGCRLWGRTVGHDWRDLAVAVWKTECLLTPAHAVTWGINAVTSSWLDLLAFSFLRSWSWIW